MYELILHCFLMLDIHVYFFFQPNDIVAENITPASILYKSIAGRYRPVSYPDGPITVRYRFIKNAYWDSTYAKYSDRQP